MFTKTTRAEERPRRNRFIEHSVPLISMVLVELTTKLRITTTTNNNNNFICTQHITIQINDMNEQKYRRVLAAPNNHKG